MTDIQAIAFDLDGTLVDSAGGIARALNTALDSVELPDFDVRTVRGWIGDGPDALIDRALRACDLQDIDLTWLTARVHRYFFAVSLAAPFGDCFVYEGIEGLLERLAVRLPLVVVTNKPSVLAQALLREAGLLGYFDSVHGADTARLRKPSPLLIEQAADALGLSPHALLMVGDTETDCRAARAAGCKAAWAGWGYGLLPPELTASVWWLDVPADLLARMNSPRLHRYQ